MTISNNDLFTQNAQRIRDVIRYIKRFKNATVVIHIDDRVLESYVEDIDGGDNFADYCE